MAPSLLAVVMLVALTVQNVASTRSSPGEFHRQQLLDFQNPTAKWPSLRFSFMLKRRSMKVHGRSNFSMVADPVLLEGGAHVLYNAFATFTEDAMIHNYTLVDGAAYYSSSEIKNTNSPPAVNCLELELGMLPPINSIVSALNTATTISTENAEVECSSDNLFQASVNGIGFALCSSGSSGLKMYGSDMDIAVEFLDTRANISAPILNSKSLPECTTFVSSSSVTSIGNALLTGKLLSSGATRRLKAEFDFSWRDSTSCSCKSIPRPCIFIHGMGIPIEMADNQDSLPRYWGNLTGHAPCCSTMKYAVLDTVNNTWTNDTQLQKVCDRALAVSETSTESTISDTIVVTHSMGKLMLAGAIASGKCSLDSSTTWVGLAAPMKGSKASDFIQESCAGDTNFVLEAMVENSGRCPPTTSLKSMPYAGEGHSTPDIDAAYAAAQEAYRSNVSALMCSESFSGLRSSNQAKLWALGMLGHHHSFQNDGMVEFQSCAAGIPESKFGNTWRDPFYRTKLNHYDMQFKYGDGLFSKAKMPVKWFECLL